MRRNDLGANVFLLLRHTGMRIGECVDLSFDCLHTVGPDQWAIHVPLGKLKTERMVPVDSFVRDLVHRLRFFRSLDPLPPRWTAAGPAWTQQSALLAQLRVICTRSATAAGIPTALSRINFGIPMPRRCSAPASTFAAVMKLLGHNSPR